MKSKNEILTDLYQSKELEELIAKIDDQYKSLHDELKQELFLILCEKPDKLICDLHEKSQLKYYVVKIILNFTRSNRSAFYRLNLFHKHTELTDWHHAHADCDPMEYEVFVEEIETQVKNMYWYKSKLIHLYAEEGSLRAVSKNTGIPTASIHLTIKNARKEIKEAVCGL